MLPLLAGSYLQEGGQGPVVPNGPGHEKGVGVLSSMGSASLEWPLDKGVLVPGGGKLCPLDISAGRGTQPIRNRTWPQSSLRLREKTEENGFPFSEAGTRSFLRKVCLPTWEQASLFTTSCLA